MKRRIVNTAKRSPRRTSRLAATCATLGLRQALAPKKTNLYVKHLKQANHSTRNGRLYKKTLTSIGSGHRLQQGAAEAYKTMTLAANNDGIYWSRTDSYRTYDAKVRLAEEKGLYSKVGKAAEPGTSNHGWALAVDLGAGANIYGTLQNNWLIENARNFGFYTIPREPWHWEYRVHEEGEGFEC